jgi:hypothetical protein
MAALLGYWEEDMEERECERSEREKEEGEVAWHAGAAPGGLLGLRRQAGGGRAGHLRASTQELGSWRKKQKGFFFVETPLNFEDFLSYI